MNQFLGREERKWSCFSGFLFCRKFFFSEGKWKEEEEGRLFSDFFSFFIFWGKPQLVGTVRLLEREGFKKINERIVDWTPFPFISEGANDNGGYGKKRNSGTYLNFP